MLRRATALKRICDRQRVQNAEGIMGRKYQSTVMIHNICFWMKKNFTLTYLFVGG